MDGTTPCIERAAAELGSISQRRRYSTYEEITLALAFAQAIRYSYDEDTVGRVDYWRYPIEP